MLAIAKRRKNLFLSLFLVFALLGFGAVGCTTMENVGGGTLGGAGLGAGISALAGGDVGTGAAIGAGIGLLGGVIKDGMEKEQQQRNYQAQTDVQLRQMRIDAEINIQVNELKDRGYTPDQYQYRTGTTANGNIYVDPIKREVYDRTEIIR